ncbi:MAG TPA: pirin family protein [Beutenbergiaceae bacterium]|nr:pirin family protein [Beutenbergiaceae bacterium]
MTNLEANPTAHTGRAADCHGPEVTVIEPRTVPLGGVRAIPVRRTLPHRNLSLIGAWCFLDQFSSTEPMTVLPHPHTGLQTVTWPISGEIRHRDSLGNDVRVRPGELNLMTAGWGVSHSEFSQPDLSGVQLWLALPTGPDSGEALFEQVRDLPVVTGPDWEFTVFIGDLAGASSPATVFSPLVGADGRLGPNAQVTLPLNPEFEHGILVFDGDLPPHGEGNLIYLGLNRESFTFTAGANGARVILIGGEPFTEPVVMFWNFIGRSHDDVAKAADSWARERASRFGVVPGHGSDHIPGPAIPPVRLRPRRSPHVKE